MNALTDFGLVGYQTYNTLKLVTAKDDESPRDMKLAINWWTVYGVCSLSEMLLKLDSIPLYALVKSGLLIAMYIPSVSNNVISELQKYTAIGETHARKYADTAFTYLKEIKFSNPTNNPDDGDDEQSSVSWFGTLRSYVPF